MKKIVKVSIADISFTLDNDAYVSLKQYIDSLHNYYDKDPDGKEIVADIEARIAELILDEQVYTKVVSKPLIDGIIAQLGSPEEIDDEAGEEASGPGPAGSASETSIPRRLHRNSEGRIFGGVCSGLARYFDINVAWIRLIFILPVFLRILASPFHSHSLHNFGEGWSWVFFLTYIVLWIALPMARTPRQKLEARGERITPSSIRQNLQDIAGTPSSKKAASVMAEILTVFGRIVLVFVKFVVAVIGFSFLFASIGLFLAMFIVLINPGANGEFLGVLYPSLPDMLILSPMWFVELILFCLMMPFLILGISLLTAAFGWKPGRVFFGVTLGIWALAMIFAGVVALTNAGYIRDRFRDGELWERSWSHGQCENEPGRKTVREIHATYGSDADSLVVIVKQDEMQSDTIHIPVRSDDDRHRVKIRRIDE